MLDAVGEASADLKKLSREGDRTAVVAVTGTGPEFSYRDKYRAAEEGERNAELFLSVQVDSGEGDFDVRTNLSYVLDRLARATGGRYDVILSAMGTDDALRKLSAQLGRQNKQLAAALVKAAPKGNYIVIDQTQNRIYLMNGGDVVLDAVCSAGSGIVLRDFSGQRKWVFDTPRGVFKVRNRVENPAWRKPDWAFIEEGKPVPKDPGDRIETGTLGEYALYLEDGYMIHGTLYTRLLGRSVTHGCIRLGPEDLQAVWDAVPVGSSVYIF